MKLNTRLLNSLKIAVCASLLSALAGWIGLSFWHGVPPAQAWLYSALAVLTALLLTGVVALASLTLWQWVLRKGGTDTQWLWFTQEPKGLAAQRKR